MKKKVLAAHEALAGGVTQVILADSRLAEPIRTALAGGGTWISHKRMRTTNAEAGGDLVDIIEEPS